MRLVIAIRIIQVLRKVMSTTAFLYSLLDRYIQCSTSSTSAEGVKKTLAPKPNSEPFASQAYANNAKKVVMGPRYFIFIVQVRIRMMEVSFWPIQQQLEHAPRKRLSLGTLHTSISKCIYKVHLFLKIPLNFFRQKRFGKKNR